MKRRRTPEAAKPAPAEPKAATAKPGAPAPEAAKPGSAYLKRLGNAATEELRKTVRAALTDLFGSFLQQAAARLTETSGAAGSPVEQRAAQDLARAIGPQVKRWLDTFLDRVESHLIGGLEPQPKSGGRSGQDDDIALVDVELRAESLYQKQISELENRLNAVRMTLYVPVYTKALAPAGLCRALQDTADAMQLSALQRRMLFEQFDLVGVPALKQLYQALLEAARLVGAAAARVEFAKPAPAPAPAPVRKEPAPAKRVEPKVEPAPVAAPEASKPLPKIDPPQPKAAPPPPPPPPPAPAPPPATPAPVIPLPLPPLPELPVTRPAPPPAPPPVKFVALLTPEELENTLPTQAPPRSAAPPAPVDSMTLSMLQLHAANAATEGYNDGSLATDLLAITQSKTIDGLADEHTGVPLQRISLAGRFLNEAIADPNIPEELRGQHESVRFPMVKSALTDASMFTALSHPLGSLVNELMLKSATSRITGSVEARRAAELLEQVIEQFDLSPEFVRHEMLKGQPIDEAQVKQFFERQKEAAKYRRELVIREVKLLVTRELDRSTFARGVPEPALDFLNTAWGPMLVKCLLQYGADHPSWKDGLALVDELLDTLDVRQPAEPPTPQWQILMHRIDKALTAEGLPADRVHAALAQLEQSRRAPPGL